MNPMAATGMPLMGTRTHLSIPANFVWSLGGSAGQAACQWGVIAVLARMGDASSVGAYALALAIASPVFLFSNLHLRALQSTDMERQFPFETCLSLRLVTTLLAAVTLAIAAFHTSGLGGYVLAATTAWKSFEAVSDVAYGHFQFEERMDRIGASMLWRGCGTLIAIGTAMHMGWGMQFGLCLGITVACAVAVVDMRRTLRADTVRIRWDPARLAPLAIRALPLGLLLLLVSINANVPRYFLAEHATYREVGIFAALAYVAIAANTLVMALGQASVPALARSFASRSGQAFVRYAFPLLSLALVLAVTVVLISAVGGGTVLAMLYGNEYAAESDAFRWLMVGGAISYLASASGYLLTSARCFTPQFVIVVVAVSITALNCFLFVPSGGLVAAAKAQASGYLAQFVLSTGTLAWCCRWQFRRDR